MALNVKQEMQRPVSLGLASLALIGWLLALCVWAYYSAQAGKLQDRLAEARAQSAQLTTALLQEQAAAGTLKEIEAKLAAANKMLAVVTQAHDGKVAELAQLQADIARARKQLDLEKATLDKITKQVADMRLQESQANEKAKVASAALAAIEVRLKRQDERLAAAQAEMAQLEKDRVDKAKAADALAATIAAGTARRDMLDGEAKTLEKSVADRRAELADLGKQIDKARSDLLALQKDVEARGRR